MLANRVAVSILKKALLNNGAVASSQLRHGHDAPQHYKEPTMDELPLPEGSWQEDYDAKQRTYNAQLGIGLTLMLGTAGFILFGGLYDFNFFVPEYKKVEGEVFYK